jgi:hypothetical protein
LGLTSLLVFAGVLFGGLAEPDASDWAQVWSLCQTARVDGGRTSELQESLSGLPSGVRLEVARHHLETAEGRQNPAVICEELPLLEPGGAWAFSLALGPGAALDAAVVAALGEGPSELMPPVLERGYARFMVHSNNASGADALQLAEALHARSNAVWSGVNLAISRTRMGAYGGASETLAELLSTEMAPGNRELLRSRLRLVHLGAGGLVRARASLGAGLAQGSGDSGIVLGLIGLEGGHWGRSRALFRSTLARDPRQAWAGRGWGLSMVPRP